MGRRLVGLVPVTRCEALVAAAALLVALHLALATAGAGAQQPPPPTTRPTGTLPPQTLPPRTPPQTLPPRPGPPIPTSPPPTVRERHVDPNVPASPLDFVLPALVLGGLLVGGYVFVRNRNLARTSVAPAMAPTATAAPSRPLSSALTDELLEVSRQLTAASVMGDVKRATVRGALSLVPADGAALVTVDAETGALAVAVESTPDLLVPAHLADGVLGRVAETGDFVELVSSSEPAIRNRPSSVLAMPLVAGGRVAALLIVVRAKDQPFLPNEVKTLRALVPMAAAVLQSERHAQSAIEDSLIDPLTGANNRRRFDRDVASAMTATNAQRPVSLAIVDLDHFKRVNDTHGHPAGDALLKAVVTTVEGAVRPGDGVYRFGGEEFCILLRETGADDARDVVERVRAAIAARPFDVGGDEPIVATASIGVATATDGAADGLVARADTALYGAKEGGRNQVVAG